MHFKIKTRFKPLMQTHLYAIYTISTSPTLDNGSNSSKPVFGRITNLLRHTPFFLSVLAFLLLLSFCVLTHHDLSEPS